MMPAPKKKKNPVSKAFRFTRDKSGNFMKQGRPTWFPKLVKTMKVKRGQHRRHIIPSHLLLDSVCSWVNANASKRGKAINQFMTTHKLKAQGNRLTEKLTVISRYIHNNENNLFPEDGGENSAIGFLPREISQVLVAKNKTAHVKAELENLKTTGFGFTHAARKAALDPVIEVIDEMERNKNTFKAVKDFLDTIVLNLELDLNKTDGMVNQTPEAIRIFQELDEIRRDGTQGDFFQVIEDFLALPQT